MNISQNIHKKMKILTQINNKKAHWIVSTTLLLATLCTVFSMAFSPVTTPNAHAGEKLDWLLDISKKAAKLPMYIGDIGTNFNGGRDKALSGAKDLVVDKVFGGLLEQIGRLLFWISTFFLMLAAWVLDASIIQSLDSNLINKITSIDTGWSLVRDVGNMFFIFILLYIAIATILQATSFNWKKTLGNLIIAAILINFSLFFTKVIIDVSNVFATTFHNSMKTEVDGGTRYGPATILESGLGLDTALDTMDKKIAVGDKTPDLNNITRGLLFIFGAIFNMIAGFVFFAGAFIFIKRTISFIFLMIFSPIGFIGFVLPATKKYSDMWWKSITENAVIAPVYLFMLYLVCNMIRSGNLVDVNGSDNSSMAIAFMGKADNFAIILNFIVLIGLMWGALVVSQAVSEKTASSSISFAGKMTGGMLAGTAMAGRQIGGRAGRWVSENETLKKGATSGSGITRAASRMALQGGGAAAKSSWDTRNTGAGKMAIDGFKGMSSMSGTGPISVGAGQNKGKGGVVAARSAQDEKIARSRQNLGNIIGKDQEGDPRMTERTKMEEVMVEKKVKDEKSGKMVNKMVATGKMTAVLEKDKKTGKMVKAKETLSARKAYVEQLEEQAKPPAKGRFGSFLRPTYYKTYGTRDRQAIKKGAEYAKKGDKETKDSIMAEQTLALENQLKGVESSTERAGIISKIGGNDLINIDPDVLSGETVAPHLSARQAKKIIEDKRSNLSDDHFEKWQKNLEKKIKETEVIAEKEKAEGALQYIKSGAGYANRGKTNTSVPKKSDRGSTNKDGNNFTINRGDQDSSSTNYTSDGS